MVITSNASLCRKGKKTENKTKKERMQNKQKKKIIKNATHAK